MRHSNQKFLVNLSVICSVQKWFQQLSVMASVMILFSPVTPILYSDLIFLTLLHNNAREDCGNYDCMGITDNASYDLQGYKYKLSTTSTVCIPKFNNNNLNLPAYTL